MRRAGKMVRKSRNPQGAQSRNVPVREGRERTGENLRKAYPVDESSLFAELLRDIDEAHGPKDCAQK